MSDLSNEFSQHMNALAARPLVDCCFSALDEMYRLGLTDKEEMQATRLSYRVQSDEDLWGQYWAMQEWIERAKCNRQRRRERTAAPRYLLIGLLAITTLCITWNISANVNRPAIPEVIQGR